MIPHDEELIKSLECCSRDSKDLCKGCIYRNKYQDNVDCFIHLLKDALECIKRLDYEQTVLRNTMAVSESPEQDVVKKLLQNYKNSKLGKHNELCKLLHEIYANKNADYGDSFTEMFAEFGIITAITRIGDKFNRLKNLYKNQSQQVKDESVRDTLLDMANYCIMTVMEMYNQKKTTKNGGTK